MIEKENQLKISYLTWFRLNNKLRKIGMNVSESGAFLLGKIGDDKISEFICYTDLDPNTSNAGYIHFRSEYYVRLWDYCEYNKLSVLADVHTHPGFNTNQSESDKMHPMIIRKNHIALIIPNFAINKFPSLKGVGIYEYRGNFKWQKYNPDSQKVILTWFYL